MLNKSIALIFFLLPVLVTLPAFAQANDRHTVKIDAQPIGGALKELAAQTGLQVVVFSQDAGDKRSPAIEGNLTNDEALTQILQDSGLTYEKIDTNTVAIKSRVASPLRTTSLAGDGRGTEGEGNLRLAQANPPVPGTGAGSGGEGKRGSETASTESPTGDDGTSSQLEEIIVTAQKKEERLQDVPVPVTVLSTEALANNNQLRLQDYYSTVPGLNLVSSYRGDANLSIRGITTGAGYGNPTVGVVVDDVPVGSSSTLGGSVQIPDFDPSELSHIEVLRGPQGTLYGASSIGGLVKFVTADPSTVTRAARLQAGVSSIEQGHGVAYSARGSANVPLSDTWAVRISGFARQDPGYIDNVQSGKRDVNTVDVAGGRVSALWRASDTVSLNLGAQLQRTSGDGAADVDLLPGLGDLEQSRLPRTGAYDKKIEFYSATLKARFASADLTAASGYSINAISDNVDFTAAFGPTTEANFGVPGTPARNDVRTTKFTQELRLAAPLGPRLQGMLGVFYTDEDSQFRQRILAADDAGALVGSWLDANWPTRFTEYAAFANLTVNFTDQFDIQFGGRESRNRQTYSEVDVGPYVDLFYPAPSPAITDKVISKDHAFTYLVTPRLRITPELMVYARLASGYRPGGPNATASVFGVPSSFEPDKTRNYEIGVKADTLDRRVQLDASVYYIDWDNIQLIALDPVSFAGYFFNASAARSKGVELSMQVRPLDGLKVGAWVAWNDAELTEDFPPTSSSFGSSGDRLPNSSRISGALSLDREFTVSDKLKGSLGGSLNYIGDRLGVFASIFATPERQQLPGYTRTDLHASLTCDLWSANLFVNNATDRRGQLAGGIGNFNPNAFVYIQPRTFGLSLSRTF